MNISLDDIRRRARVRDEDARRKVWMAGGIGILCSSLFLKMAVGADDPMMRIGFGAVIAWMLYFVFLTYRRTWPHPVSADMTVPSGIEHYRGELERARRNFIQIWQWLGPLLVAMALVIAPGVNAAIEKPSLALNVLPFFTLLLVWFFVYLRQRRVELQRIDEEISALDGYAGGERG